MATSMKCHHMTQDFQVCGYFVVIIIVLLLEYRLSPMQLGIFWLIVSNYYKCKIAFAQLHNKFVK